MSSEPKPDKTMLYDAAMHAYYDAKPEGFTQKIGPTIGELSGTDQPISPEEEAARRAGANLATALIAQQLSKDAGGYAEKPAQVRVAQDALDAHFSFTPEARLNAPSRNTALITASMRNAISVSMAEQREASASRDRE